jgi:hypothetical protein
VDYLKDKWGLLWEATERKISDDGYNVSVMVSLLVTKGIRKLQRSRRREEKRKRSLRF